MRTPPQVLAPDAPVEASKRRVGNWAGWVPVGCLLLPFVVLMGVGLYFLLGPPPAPAADASPPTEPPR
jgi:hypothetical protein